MYKVIKPFKFALGGHTVVTYEMGDQDLPDEVAEVALAEGWAKKEKAKPAPQNKMKAQPKNKLGPYRRGE